MESNTTKVRKLPFRLDPLDPRKVTLLEVSEEIYHALGREIWAHQKRMYRQGKCQMPSAQHMWKCDGDCSLCEYASAGRDISLDQPLRGTQENGCTLGDCLPDTASDPAVTVPDHVTLEQAVQRLSELCPDAPAVWHRMADSGDSQRKALDELGKSRTTYRSQYECATKLVCKEFDVRSLEELWSA